MERGLAEVPQIVASLQIKNRLLSRFSRSAFPKFQLRESTTQRTPPDYSYIRLLAYLPEHNEAACGALAAGYETRSGLHACRTAHIVIVDDLARLHSDHADLEWVLHVLYIVARSLPLTTSAVALSVNGDMKRIPVTSV